MNILNILTTATPRPELHEETVFRTIELLVKNKCQDVINWHVNLDSPSMFTTAEKNKAIETILRFNKSSFNTYFYRQHDSAHFGAAARRLYTSCKVKPGNNIFMWLEDDWKLIDTEFFNFVKRFFESSHSFLLCSVAHYVTGNPIIFREDFFNEMVSSYEKINGDYDPELVLFETVKKYFNIENPRTLPPNSIHKQFFIDAGREWRAARNIIKLDKYETHLKDTTWAV